MAGVALLVGLFMVPTALLALGHRLRDRSRLQRGAFWGGVIGHGIAVLVAMVALHWPPVVWTGGVREAVVFGAILTGGLLGVVMGAARARWRSSRHA